MARNRNLAVTSAVVMGLLAGRLSPAAAQPLGPEDAQQLQQAPTMRSTKAPVGPQIFRPASPLKIVAQVNNQRVSRIELGQACLEQFGNQVLETVVNRALIVQRCQQLGLEITDKEVQEEIKATAERFGIPVNQWLAMLKKERGLSAKRYAQDIVWPTIALQRLAQAQLKVSEEELFQAFETQYGAARKVRLILVDDRQLAEDIHRQVTAEPAKFRLLAKHSLDPSRSLGGLIQPVRRHVGYRSIEEHAFALQPGQISPVFLLGSGSGGSSSESQEVSAGSATDANPPKKQKWVILKCEDHIAPAKVQLKDVREKLISGIRETKLRRYGPKIFVQLKESAKIINVFRNPELQAKHQGIAAIVNGQAITMEELAEECILRNGKEILEGLIGRKLLEQELKRQNLQVTRADLDEELSRSALQFGHETNGVPNVQSFVEKATAERNISKDFFINEVIWPAAALRKLALHTGQVQVTREDIQKSIEANFGEKVQARACVLHNERRAREVWEKANELRSLPQFEELVREYSVDHYSREVGGRIPPIHRHSGRKMLEEEAFRLKPGEISSILQLDDKWVILFCEGRTQPINVEYKLIEEEVHRDVLEKKLRVVMSQEYQRLKDSAFIDNFLAQTTQRPSRKSQVQGPQLPSPIRMGRPPQRSGLKR